MSKKRKLNVLCLRDKLKIVNAFESGKSRNQIKSDFGLAESTYYKIIKSKEIIKSQCRFGHGNIKRSRLCEFPDVEKCLLEWIHTVQSLDMNISIDTSLLKQKSKNFAIQLGIQNFSASNGWFEGFKKRNNISLKKLARGIRSEDQKVEPKATREMVRHRINSMRSARRKETVKVRKAGEQGELYEPKLWYFHALDFLDGDGEETTEEAGKEQKFSETTSFIESMGSQMDTNEGSTTMIPGRRLSVTFSNDSLSNPTPSDLSEDNAPVVAFTTEVPQPKIEKQKPKVSKETIKDTHIAFGRYVAHKLETLKHTQRIFAEKIINEVIFEAELGNLSRGCRVFMPKRKRKDSDGSDSE